MAEGLKKHGITADTVKNLMFSAGTYYKNLKYASNTWTGDVLGVTSGGGKFSYEPNYVDAELDGATVVVRGAKIKMGEKATMVLNMTEFIEGRVKEALHLVEDTTETVTGYKKYKTKAIIDDTDYLDNVAFVGNLVDGRQVIIIMENAICASAFEIEPKGKEQATYELTFECTATFEQEDLDHLPIYIYFPQVAEV